ncbi:MAG: hypothetical protein CVU41_12780 [Chloroflexi bacterium HGW-Chloroflexi-3]|nr:MAG: hypothetical protein CVU41_12780 [Chloroflexi bacterium HGW-Chloroflexi-3]
MSIIDYILRQKSILQIMMRVLIIFVFFVGILPIERPGVVAQVPDKSQVVYLPLVFKNSTVSCPEGPDQWLCLFNAYRVTAGLNPVSQNTDLSYGLDVHTNYLIKCPKQAEVNMHEETVCEGWTALGRSAGAESNMVWNPGPNYSVKQSVDIWIQFARHRYGMLHPDLSQSGFDLSCNSNYCAAGINVLAGLEPKSIREVVYPAENQIGFPKTEFPITWAFYTTLSVSTINVDSIKLVDKNGNLVQGTTTIYNDYVKEVVFTPETSLLPNQNYYIEMKIKIDGNPKFRSWSFTTAP